MANERTNERTYIVVACLEPRLSLVAQGLAVLLGELHHRLLGRHEGLEAALVRLAPLRLLRRQVAVLMDGSMDGSMDRDIEIFDVCLFVCLFVLRTLFHVFREMDVRVSLEQ